MAQDFTKDYKSQVTDSAHTLRNANSNDALIGIRLTNITTSAVTVEVWIDVAAAGSTASVVYLAKDSLMKSRHFKKMYNNKLDKFLDCKLKYDPNQFFQSNMYRRLFLSKNK